MDQQDSASRRLGQAIRRPWLSSCWIVHAIDLDHLIGRWQSGYGVDQHPAAMLLQAAPNWDIIGPYIVVAKDRIAAIGRGYRTKQWSKILNKALVPRDIVTSKQEDVRLALSNHLAGYSKNLRMCHWASVEVRRKHNSQRRERWR